MQGCTSENVQKAWDEINPLGFDLGGAGPAVRTSMSCVGAARCEQSCYDEASAHRAVINNFLDDIHRPALPYKFKFKFSGCSNDCMNAIQRSDMAVIGTWRDNIQTDEALAKKWFAKHGMNELVNDVVARCPTKAIQIKEIKKFSKADNISTVALDETQGLEIDNKDCVRCMHCINVMTGALAAGKDRGASILIGGKSHLKIGGLLGTMIVPFIKLDTDEDREKLVELAKTVLDFFADNALEHERTGEMIERIGLVSFLEGIGVDVDDAEGARDPAEVPHLGRVSVERDPGSRADVGGESGSRELVRPGSEARVRAGLRGARRSRRRERRIGRRVHGVVRVDEAGPRLAGSSDADEAGEDERRTRERAEGRACLAWPHPIRR